MKPLTIFLRRDEIRATTYTCLRFSTQRYLSQTPNSFIRQSSLIYRKSLSCLYNTSSMFREKGHHVGYLGLFAYIRVSYSIGIKCELQNSENSKKYAFLMDYNRKVTLFSRVCQTPLTGSNASLPIFAIAVKKTSFLDMQKYFDEPLLLLLMEPIQWKPKRKCAPPKGHPYRFFTFEREKSVTILTVASQSQS